MNEAQEIMGAIKHPLAHPIKAHGNELTSVTLRRPTAKECRAIGRMPYGLDDRQMPTPELSVATKYLVVCLDIPESSVDQLDLSDLNQLIWALIGFFLNPASTTSTS